MSVEVIDKRQVPVENEISLSETEPITSDIVAEFTTDAGEKFLIHRGDQLMVIKHNPETEDSGIFSNVPEPGGQFTLLINPLVAVVQNLIKENHEMRGYIQFVREASNPARIQDASGLSLPNLRQK